MACPGSSVPGRELPADELWQVDEAEIMKLEDYDKIVDQGFGPWLDNYYRTERLPAPSRSWPPSSQTIPDALAALSRPRASCP